MSSTVANGRQLSNVDIAVFALYQLGGVNRKVHLEEIASECHRLAPKRFGWELPRFQAFPDKKAAYYALKDAEKPKLGALVERLGTREKSKGGQKFWLTERGAKWIKEDGERVASELNAESAAPTQRQQAEETLRVVKDKKAFVHFRAKGGVDGLTVYDLANFLGNMYETSPSAVRKKFADMKTKAELTDDAEISEFLLACEQAPHFARLLNIGVRH